MGENIGLFRRMGHTEQLHRHLDEFRRVMVEDVLQHNAIPEEIRKSTEFSICIYFFVGGIMNTYQQWAEETLDCTLEEISQFIAEMIRCSGEAFLRE